MPLSFLFRRPIAGFIAFLYNSIFPPLLSDEEEAEALSRLEQGDEEARNLLIERNLRLVTHICKKFDSTGVDREDLISIGTVGLIKAISTFHPEKGARLATYAARCIENEVLMHLRAIRNQKTETSLYDPVGADKEGNQVALIDILDSPEASAQELVELDEERRALHQMLPTLESQELYVLTRRYGLDNKPRATQKEVAAHLGISRSYVSRIEKKALGKLRAKMKKDEQLG